MKSEIKRDVVNALTLTAKESNWLRGVMQNELYPEESTEDKDMRSSFFFACEEILPEE